ncbi:MAG: class I SAM-dependent methyltransferase [Myxococcota bacterium]
MSRPHPGSFDRVADIYDATRGLPPEAEARMAAKLAELFRRAQPARRLLEVGVGTGRVALPLAGHGFRVVGVDVSRSMLAKLRAKAGDAPLLPTLGSAMDLPLRDGAFDGALFVHVLHLVPDAPRVIRQAIRVVRSGGVLAFGGEDFGVSPLAVDVRAAMREAIRRVTGRELGGSGAHARVLASILHDFADVGSPVERALLARWESTATARGWIRQLENRDMSWMWRVPDDRLPEIVEELRPRMLALCGDLDRPHAVPRSMSALVTKLH